jgi:hypothetical protein
MPALSRWFSPIGGLAVALSAAAGPGYLPTVGPAPVRFETPAPPVVAPVALPPLVFIEPRPATDTNETVAPAVPTGPVVATTEAASAPVEPSILISPLGPLEPAGGATNSPAAPADTEVVAPQMLLKYFTRPAGTNSAGVSIFAPVGFVPPQPLVPPSSSATFQTTPSAKP